MRLVTIIEVTVRRWVQRLIDHGSPYTERAAGLAQSLKFDFAIAQAIQGRRVSLGELVAHEVSLSDLGRIASCFKRLLDEDFFDLLAGTYDRFKVERQGAPKVPIISDLGQMKAHLSRLFHVRHILTHEAPAKSPCSNADVDAFLSAASEFVATLEEALQNRLRPGYPLTTLDMLDEAGREYNEAKEELAAVLTKVEPLVHDPRDRDYLRRSQEAWTAYCNLQAELRACHLEGGSLQPLINVRETTRLTKARIEDLRWWLERAEGDL